MNTSSGGDEIMRDASGAIDQDLFELEKYINDMWFFLPIPIVYLSPLGVILDVNKGFEELCKCSKDSLIGKLIADLCPAFHEEYYRELITAGKQVKRLESTVVDPNGSRTPVSIYAYARQDETGTTVGCFAACIDITERKHQEALLVKSETEYRTTLIQW